MLPDRITPYDNLDMLPSHAEFLSSQLEEVTAAPLSARKGRSSNRDINLQEDFNNSQFLHDAPVDEEELAVGNMEDYELDIDFGIDDMDERPTKLMDKSVDLELGRDAPADRPVEDDLFSEMDLGGPSKDRHTRDLSPGLELDFGDDVRIHNDEDIQMGDADDFQFQVEDQSVVPGTSVIPDISRARISESPLSDIDEDFAKEVEQEYSRHMNTSMYELENDVTNSTVIAPQRAKKRKIMQPDDQTMLSNAHIKEQQAKRDNILKPESFLSYNPYLLSLMGMQKAGDFYKNILNETRSDEWAPELKGLLSLDFSRPNYLKRKRDSGVADVDSEEEQGASKSPRLEIPEDETVLPVDEGLAANQTIGPDGTVLEIPGDDDGQVIFDDDGRPASRNGPSSPIPAFDETTAPLVHPGDTGPVSIGTKHAVHLLRDLFGAEAADNADKRKKTSVVFQELLPEKRTTKADATKMFFECLVLATKDAIKVEQPEGTLGGPICVRGKRGLWGDWAEREAGGEIAQQQTQHSNEPEKAITSAATVSVEA
jgi:cohesin complex subunit SCC1